MTLFCGILAAVGVGLFAPALQEAPIVPTPPLFSKAWELKYEFEDVQRISVTHAGDSHPSTYWYMLYQVTNDSDQEVDFYPSFELVTDSLTVTVGGEKINTTVFEAIRRRHHKAYPFLVDPSRVSGRLLQGVDNTRSSVAIFRQFDLESNAFTIYASGLSGEIERVANSTFDPKKPESSENEPFFYLRKTLAVLYTLPGDLGTREQAVPTRTGRQWVMR